jgi:hypothetical protein
MSRARCGGWPQPRRSGVCCASPANPYDEPAVLAETTRLRSQALLGRTPEVAAAPDPAASACAGRRQVRGVRRRPALHRRWSRAGHPARGGHGARAPVRREPLATVHDLGLRHRGRRDHHVGRWASPCRHRRRPGDSGDRRRQPAPVAGLASQGGARRGLRATRGCAAGPSRRLARPGPAHDRSTPAATAGSSGCSGSTRSRRRGSSCWTSRDRRAGDRGQAQSPSMPHDAMPLGTEAQWTSWDGEVLECAMWWGPLARRPGRSARILHHAPTPSRSTSRWPSREPTRDRTLRPRAGSTNPTRRRHPGRSARSRHRPRPTGREVEPGPGLRPDRPCDTDLPYARRYAVLRPCRSRSSRCVAWLRDTRHHRPDRSRSAGSASTRTRCAVTCGSAGCAGDGEQATMVLTRVAGQPGASSSSSPRLTGTDLRPNLSVRGPAIHCLGASSFPRHACVNL